jgi:tripartite-type tricarboxylate transporter receptor subunit TctC
MTALTRRAALGAAAALLLAAGARAQPPVSFEGRTTEWIIPFAEAGGSDVWARVLAPFLARHLPGRPNVVIRNIPGGGSITGADEFAQRARPDGLTFLGASASTQLPFLLGDRRVRCDDAQWVPLLVSPTGGVVHVHAGTGISSHEQIAQLRGQELVFPGATASGLDVVPILALHVLGLNVRYVGGMRGSGEAWLAVERGDFSIDHQTTPAYRTQVLPMVQARTAVPLFSYGIIGADGRVARDPSFPDIPTLEEVYERIHGRAPSGPAYQAYLACSVSAFAGQKPAVLKRETPAPIIAAYRAAFERVVAAPELIANRGEILGDDPQAFGEAADRLNRVATTISPEARSFVRAFLAQNHNLRL